MHYLDEGNIHGVQVVGDLIYVAAGDDGLEILRINETADNTITTDMSIYLILLAIPAVLVVLVILLRVRNR
jgi:hypothetical protein